MMNPRLAQCYYALPDLENVRFAIENWFEHELVDTRSYVTEEEMYDLFDRVNEMKASTIELAFLYTFLIAAGAASLTQTTKKSREILESLYSIKSARKFAGMIFELITIDQMEQHQRFQQQQQQQESSASSSSTPTTIEDENITYDWNCLSKCPTSLLHCRLHSMLCCFFHQARDEQRSISHGNHAIRFARKYGLFEQIEESKKVNSSESSKDIQQQQHIYALQRLQFDLTVYPRLSMNISLKKKKDRNGKKQEIERCILLETEACQDPNLISFSPRNNKKLTPLAFDFQCLKLILSEIRSTAFHQTEQELKMNAEQNEEDEELNKMYGTNPSIRAEIRRKRQKEQSKIRSIRAIANDDVVLALMDLLPSWTKVDVKKNWMQESSQIVLDAGSIINMLWARYSCNRLRTENLLQTIDLYEMSWELQARALSAAQDTLYLLAQVRQLLRTPFQFASAREWLFGEAEWAVNVFNQLMQIEITRELNTFPSSPIKEEETEEDQIEKENSTITPYLTPNLITPTSSHQQSRESTPAQFSTPNTSSKEESRRNSGMKSNQSTSENGENTTNNSPNNNDNQPLSLQISQRRRKAIGEESNEQIISMKVATSKINLENLEIESKSKTYKNFAWFIFGFQGIYEILQDLHCFGPASFEASRILLRIQNPPKPFQTENEKVLLEEIHQYNAKLITGGKGVGSGGELIKRSPSNDSSHSKSISPSSSTLFIFSK